VEGLKILSAISSRVGRSVNARGIARVRRKRGTMVNHVRAGRGSAAVSSRCNADGVVAEKRDGRLSARRTGVERLFVWGSEDSW